MSDMAPAENRPLEGLEALYAYSIEKLGDATTGSATRIEGVLLPHGDSSAQERICFEEQAKKVVKSLVQAHPLLRSTVRLEESCGGLASRRNLVPLSDEFHWPTLQVEYEEELTKTLGDVESEEETGWQCSLRRQLDRRFVHDEALIRFLLHFPTGHEHSGSAYLILSAHHGLFDGRSLTIIAKEFIEGLRLSVAKPDAKQLVAPSLQKSSSLTDLIGDKCPSKWRFLWSAVCWFFCFLLGRALPSANKTYSFDCALQLSEPSVGRHLYRKLSDDFVAKLSARCKEDGIRLTSAIVAAFSGPGLGRHLKRPHVRNSIGLECVVDLRRYIEEDADGLKGARRSRALGNLVGSLILRVPVASKDSKPSQMDKEGLDAAASVLERAPIIQQDLERKLSDRQFLGLNFANVGLLNIAADKLWKKIKEEGYHGRDFYTGVSNLGRLNLSGDCDGGMSSPQLSASEHWFMTRQARVGAFCYLTCSYIPGHGMCVVLSRPDPICSLESAQGILDRTISALDAYATS